MSRAAELVRSMPLATLGIIAICVAAYLLQIITNASLQTFTMCPRLVLYLHEYYRIITSALLHANLMHIGMNMLSTSAIGSMLENKLGTLRMMFTILWAILATSVVYISIAYGAYKIFGKETWMYEHAVGFSGVIFHLSVLECNMISSSQSRSVFGFLTVPSYLYPWALLVILQMIMPNLSFLGHLAGIITGTLQYFGMFECVMFSDAYLQEMENSWRSVQWMARSPNFVSTPAGSTRGGSGGGGHVLGSTSTSYEIQSPSALGRSIRNGAGMARKMVCDVLETIQVALFGRGRTANSNIQLGSIWPSTPSGTSAAASDIDADDEDWVGLPSPSQDQREREPLTRLV